MSLSRQRPRTRVNSRSNTMPSLSNTAVNTDPIITSIDSFNAFLPSIEESLQDWLSRSIPDTPSSSVSWLLDICRCCNQTDCENLEEVSSTIRKLESDARLAAVIGQSLLQKHEQYVSESNDMKQLLEQQVDRLQDKVRELEQSLIESDNLKQEYMQEKNKIVWECQKIQKTLDDTVSDLDTCNSRCLELGSELKTKMNEVEKLRVFKFMARQADIREDTLRAKLEDVKQELAISRKAELTLESKHKKLKSKHESICREYERLKTEQKEMDITKDHQINVLWLRESNEKLRKDVLKLTSALLSPAAADLQMTNNSQNHLIELIKELASANNKLKNDLLDCTDVLMECRSELYANKQDPQEMDPLVQQEDDNQSRPGFKKPFCCDDKNDNDKGNNEIPKETSWLQESNDTIPKLRRTSSKRSYRYSKQQQQDETGTQCDVSQKTAPKSPLPDTTSAPTVVHHHYHYYMRNKLLAEKGKTSGNNSSSNHKKSVTHPQLSLSAASSTSSLKLDTTSPFRQLHHQVANVLQRLQQTDIRALNRRLRRAFDILELSSMSNSIIENIITDVDGLRAYFLWTEDKAAVKQEAWVQDVSMLEFFPMISLVQEMLKEISQLRTTMNDLQVEYVKKVEESDIRLEKEILQKQREQERRHNTGNNDNNKATISAFTWFSNVFQRSPLPTAAKEQTKRVKPAHSNGSLHARFVASNISDTSIHSTSIHPLSKPKMIPSNSTTTLADKSYCSNNDGVVTIRRQKSDMDRYGPPSSFPTRSPAVAIGGEKSKRRSVGTAPMAVSFSPSSPCHLHTSTSTHTTTKQSFTVPLRASQSAGTVRRSQSMQVPALEYVVRRKRSTLGLSSSSSNDYDLIGSQTTSADMSGAFATSWLGNK